MKTIKYYLILTIVSLIAFSTQVRAGSNTNFPDDESKYVLAIEKSPQPIGGIESIMKKIVYPSMALKTKVEGKVYVLAYINEKGDVDDVKVVKGIGAGCDEEAVRAVKSAKFLPGMDKGVVVKTKFTLAINFKL